jgi:hypothetical protein
MRGRSGHVGCVCKTASMAHHARRNPRCTYDSDVAFCCDIAESWQAVHAAGTRGQAAMGLSGSRAPG